MQLITDLLYFPPGIYYKKSIQCTNIEFIVYEPFRKMGFHNRCSVVGAEGPQLLSIPLEGGRNQSAPLATRMIANRYRWQDQHWKALCSCYNRSPWFMYYRGSLENLFMQPHERLIDWTLACFHWVQQQLGLEQGITLRAAYEAGMQGVNTEDWRNRVTPKGLKTEYPPQRRYPQVFEAKLGFIPHQSILDLLFCTGPQALAYLQEEGNHSTHSAGLNDKSPLNSGKIAESKRD